MDAYHRNICDAPSLSSSMARTIVNECPAFLHANSYLNPNFTPEPKEHFEFGTAAHLMFMEPDQLAERLEIINAPDWRKKDAQEARAVARTNGKVPMLIGQMAELEAMRAALFAHSIASKAFVGGQAEMSAFVRDGNIWLKARPDYLRPESLVDYKTSTTANPKEFARRAFALGYYQQAAWYLDVLKAATGEVRSDFWFVTQAKVAPYLVTVTRFDDDAIEAGRTLNRKAIEAFKRCVDTGDWPGYRAPETPGQDTAFILTLPTFAQREVDQLIAA
ncbi:hypothetical protein A6A04_02940 [Paramagnetospirillum marisnigri]|uniref:Putative exodeoxyribonuclease 8 PDDEXK-like domain-containing protein n=2 Tax=Paramagnetospirillum marisnigri TaxID=1285242 RepID=A0A178MMD6_9PROT|nr:hypothetical protein A6A04_02940 [Paramagnetospirillum marisnigri]